jgi:cystathionine beta-lyase
VILIFFLGPQGLISKLLIFPFDIGRVLMAPTTFGKEGEGFMRLNVACPRATLEKALKQLEQAVMDLK